MRNSFILQLLGWTLVAGLDFAINRATRPWASLAWASYAALLLGGIGFTISSLLYAIYRRWLPTRGPRIAIGALAGALAGSVAWYTLTNAIDRAVDYPDYEPLVDGLFGRGMLFFFIMLTWHGAFLALQASRRAAAAEDLAKDARLAALRYQLDPHFLFNVLSSVVTLIDEDPARAQRMLELLSSLLRRTLDEDITAEISLDRELDLIDRYLEIQHVRFEDKLRVEVNVPAAARRCAMPPLVLHTLVENAVKHGLQTAEKLPVDIVVTGSYDGRALRLDVSNSGHMAAPNGRGVGLRNVKARLDTLYPNQSDFTIVEREGAVHATMEIRSPRVLS